jgi:putative DNA primase/helicase
MKQRLSFADMKALLVERLDGLVRELAPDCKPKGGIFVGKCPWRADRSGGSFVIWRRGRAAGAWKDYATEEAGDALDLVAFARCGANGKASREERINALRWAEAWLGLSTTDPQTLGRAREKAARALKEAEAAEEEKRRRKRRRAHELWMSAKPIAGTPAETYLRARGVDPAAIQNWADGFRFIARLEHWLERGFYGPALVAAMRHPAKGFAALHAVWLTPDGAAKARVSPAKLTLGSSMGSAMRITSGLPPASAPAQPAGGCPIALCEGPEDGASVAQACPDFSVWAVGGLNNLGRQIIPPDAPYVVVCADNDWDKPQARKALDANIEALKTQGKPVAIARAFRGKDMNDLARLGSA